MAVMGAAQGLLDEGFEQHPPHSTQVRCAVSYRG